MMMMSRSRSAPVLFPSSDELEAAESLLLLLNPSSAMEDAKLCQSIYRSSSLVSVSTEEDSPVVSSISDSLSYLPIGSKIQQDPLLILSIAASLQRIDTKGMQRAARKIMKQGPAQFTKPKPKPTCSSSDISSECSASSVVTTISSGRAAPEKGALRLWRRGEEIVKFLIASTSCGKPVTEAEIRRELGNGPDTSKALRLLVKNAGVKRFGTGGKKNPYLYMPKRHY